VRLYNIANVKPSETFNLQVAGQDVPAGFHKLKAAVVAAEGQIRVAELNEQDKLNVSGQLEFDIPRKQQQAVEKLLTEIGEVFSRSTTQAGVTETATDRKVGYKVSLKSVASLPPREKVTLGIQVTDVDQTAANFVSAVREAKGVVAVGPQIGYKPNGEAAGRIVFAVPLSAKDDLLRRFKSAGVVRLQETAPNPQVPETSLAMAYIDVLLTNATPIVPTDEGLWPQIRTGLSYSFKVLSWSVMVILLGVCVVLPWALILFGIYKLVRRWRRKPETATA